MILTVNLCFAVRSINETKTKCACAVIYSVELYKMIMNYLSRPRPIFLRVTGRRHRALRLRNFSNSLRSTCTQYGRPYRLTQCSLFYLHVTGSVLHIHSEPVLSDSVVSTPVVCCCVAGCLMVRFYVISSKCSKLCVCVCVCVRVCVV